MNKSKSKFLSILLEIVLELIIALICLGIGILMLWVFGVDFSSPNFDWDIALLLGALIFIILFLLVYFSIDKFKKKKNK